MAFLNMSKEKIKYLTSEARHSSTGNKAQTCYVTGQTFTVKPSPTPSPSEGGAGSGGGRSKAGNPTYKPCLACNVEGTTDLTVTLHSMEKCDIWTNLSQK